MSPELDNCLCGARRVELSSDQAEALALGYILCWLCKSHLPYPPIHAVCDTGLLYASCWASDLKAKAPDGTQSCLWANVYPDVVDSGSHHALILDFDCRRLCLLFFHSSHAKYASTSSLPPSRLSLHLLADLDVDFEELCYASIQAN
jgi:hypothetical protein